MDRLLGCQNLKLNSVHPRRGLILPPEKYENVRESKFHTSWDVAWNKVPCRSLGIGLL